MAPELQPFNPASKVGRAQVNTVSAGTFPLIPLTGEIAKGIPPNSIAVKLVGVATGLMDTTRLNDVEGPQFKILGVTA